MKILILTNMRPSVQQPYAGIFVLNQYEMLKTMGTFESVTLFSMERKFTGTAGSLIKYAGAFFRFIPYLFRRYQVVHVHFFYPFVLLGLLYKLFHRKSAVVVTFHGADVTFHIRSKAAQRFFSWAAQRSDYLISVSHDLSRVVTAKLGLVPHRVLCAGIDDKVFYKMNDVAKEYDFIFAGSFTHRKGADLFIEAIQLLNRTDLRICVAGAGIYLDGFKSLANRYSIEVMQRQDQHQLRLLFNKSRFLVLPSRNEPFGLVVTEAMYCGTPVIVSRNGGVIEQVAEGVNGFFIDPFSAAGIKGVLMKALAMPPADYRDMAMNALASNKEFSLKKVCQATTEIYQSLAVNGSAESKRPPAGTATKKHTLEP